MGEYHWGAEADGLAVGLAIDAATLGPGEALPYRVAVENRGAAPRRLVLFSDIEGPYRTRVVGTPVAGGEALVAGAVRPRVPSSSGYRVEVTLAPGERHERPGAALVVPPDLHGEVRFELRLGGTPSMATEVCSGSVTVQISA